MKGFRAGFDTDCWRVGCRLSSVQAPTPRCVSIDPPSCPAYGAEDDATSSTPPKALVSMTDAGEAV